MSTQTQTDSTQELRANSMMAHLLDSLENRKDIGHYGRLVFLMVARYWLSDEELVQWLQKDPDCDETKAQGLLKQVQARGYNPPKRERILDWMRQQQFPICPESGDPGACNVYKDLEFPQEVYQRIADFYEQQASEN